VTALRLQRLLSTLQVLSSSVTVDVGGAGYTSPQVSFSGGGGSGALVSIGNQLIDRAYATDYVTQPAVISAGCFCCRTLYIQRECRQRHRGTFTLTVDAVTTGVITWNATAVDVQSALTAAGISARSAVLAQLPTQSSRPSALGPRLRSRKESGASFGEVSP